MAATDTMEVLSLGVDVWNAWRRASPFFRPDLRGADLSGRSLDGINLEGADLDGADLTDTTLCGARLAAASLRGACLRQARLRGCLASGAVFDDARLDEADLHSADLHGAVFTRANLRRADLESANLKCATLSGASLRGARLVGAVLNEACLVETDVAWSVWGPRQSTGPLLPIAPGQAVADSLRDPRAGAFLSDADKTSLGSVDLSSARGLDQVVHEGTSSIGVDTLMLSAASLHGAQDAEAQAGRIEAFLRGAGVHHAILAAFPVLVRYPIHYTVFISYSQQDLELAGRVHASLEKRGVKVWRDTQGMLPGARLSTSIRDALRGQERVLLLCSRASLASSWVVEEIAMADELDAASGRAVGLIPLLLDDSAERWIDRARGPLRDRLAIDLRGVDQDPLGFELAMKRIQEALRTAVGQRAVGVAQPDDRG